ALDVSLPSSYTEHSLFLHGIRDPPDLHSFPTRRSSDLPPCRSFPPRYRLPGADRLRPGGSGPRDRRQARLRPRSGARQPPRRDRSEEHTSELQSREKLVCRLLLEKKTPNKQHNDALTQI